MIFHAYINCHFIDTGLDGIMCKYNRVLVFFVEGNFQPHHICWFFLGTCFFDIFYGFQGFLSTFILFVFQDFPGTMLLAFYFLDFHDIYIFCILVVLRDVHHILLSDMEYMMFDFPHIVLFMLFYRFFFIIIFLLNYLSFLYWIIMIFPFLKI